MTARYSLLVLLLALLSRSAVADRVVYFERGVEWRYFPGTQEASAPEPTAWRPPDFDASEWEANLAPFGYGDPPYGTDLGESEPPMEGHCGSRYLRREFQIPILDDVVDLRLGVDFEDGFVAWINGVEVHRENVPGAPGTFAPHDSATDRRSHESGTYADFPLIDFASYLVQGTNVIACHAINLRPANNDFKIDLEIFDPSGPDFLPPIMKEVIPPAEVKVRRFDVIEVLFSESVLGVDARDLLVGGQPASTVRGRDAGSYRFTFRAQATGRVSVAWALGHGIVDTSKKRNVFAGGI